MIKLKRISKKRQSRTKGKFGGYNTHRNS